MTIHFTKYHGTGNDFILIDNMNWLFPKSEENVRFLCNRRFGIGADGLILLEGSKNSGFSMVYYNSDGGESTFCGNGGRCFVAFAYKLGLISNFPNFEFTAKDGPHLARMDGNLIHLKMKDVPQVGLSNFNFVLDTGSPHYVKWVESLDKMDVRKEGALIRNSPPFAEKGINVNFIERREGRICVRTFERGVEDETLSCGTGVTASALVAAMSGFSSPVQVETLGGNLEVRFEHKLFSYSNIWLVGPAKAVFEGQIDRNELPNQVAGANGF